MKVSQKEKQAIELLIWILQKVFWLNSILNPYRTKENKLLTLELLFTTL